MRTKRVRLGIVVAAMSAVIGGTALGAAQTAAVSAGTGLIDSPAAVDISPAQGPASAVESFAAAAVYDWN
jgi:hypothetical protein